MTKISVPQKENYDCVDLNIQLHFCRKDWEKRKETWNGEKNTIKRNVEKRKMVYKSYKKRTRVFLKSIFCVYL